MLRAVIYARCSTEEESQKDALVKQVAEAKECVFNKEWLLIDTYVESRSGTTTKGRKEYNRLYEDLLQDKFDVVVIKSQDRLMRNTKDWYLFVDRLTTQQKKLYMYIDNKFYSTDDALITGIKAILAEDYSRELSKKINNAHKGRQRNNGHAILTSNTYGYKKLPDKSVVLIPEEAEVKKRMYELCAQGYGSRTIATILRNEGITNRKGKPFEATSILRIIRNPMNKGTIVMNKKHFDFDSKRTIKVPKEEQFVYENKVPRIVSDELWEKANSLINKRSANRNYPDLKTVGLNPVKYPLTGKIVCGICGKPFYRRARRTYKDKKLVYDWKCKGFIDVGRNVGDLNRPQIRRVDLNEVDGCDNIHLNEEMLDEFLEKELCEEFNANKQKIVADMIKVLKKALKENESAKEIEKLIENKEKIKKQMDVLVDKLLSVILDDYVYKTKQESLSEKLQKNENRLKELMLKVEKSGEIKSRIAGIEKVIEEKGIYEKATVSSMVNEIHKIIVYPRYMEVQFSSSKVLGITNDDVLDDMNTIRLDYGLHFDYRAKQREVLQRVVDYIAQHPNTSAKELANQFDISVSGMQQRLMRLRRQGRVRFVGSGGKGYWEALENSIE